MLCLILYMSNKHLNSTISINYRHFRLQNNSFVLSQRLYPILVIWDTTHIFLNLQKLSFVPKFKYL